MTKAYFIGFSKRNHCRILFLSHAIKIKFPIYVNTDELGYKGMYEEQSCHKPINHEKYINNHCTQL